MEIWFWIDFFKGFKEVGFLDVGDEIRLGNLTTCIREGLKQNMQVNVIYFYFTEGSRAQFGLQNITSVASGNLTYFPSEKSN